MSDVGRGLPLLSGPPPSAPPESPNACRKCNKEFNFIFIRPRRCNHCGYSYCHTCSDYQALMPRTGSDTGYDGMPVCGFCIEYLAITAGGKSHLKTLPLAKLKKYVNAYDIKIDRAVEKDDVIERILAVRGPNGCLPRANENYYRRYSVPNRIPPGRPRGLFSRTGDAPPPVPPPRPTTSPTFEFARPDLVPDDPPPAPPRDPPYAPRNTRPQNTRPQSRQQQQRHYSPPPHPPPRPHSSYSQAPPHPQPQFHTPSPNHGNPGHGGHHGPYMPMPQPPPQYTRPQPQQPPPQNHNTRPGPAFPTPQMRSPSPQPPPAPPRPRAASATPAPPPDLEQLTAMDPASIKSLSIGALKSVLFTNHVNAGQILEKSDLVEKVLGLVEAERVERERQRLAEEREEMERIAREAERREEEEAARWRAAERERQPDGHRSTEWTTHEDVSGEGGSGGWDDTPIPGSSPPRTAPKANPVPPKAPSHLERTGLCVVCQDEEANIAIVDCGHLAMCRGCSDLIMASSRECPLCRTRIVTEARLLRIFKT